MPVGYLMPSLLIDTAAGEVTSISITYNADINFLSMFLFDMYRYTAKKCNKPWCVDSVGWTELGRSV